MKREEIEKEVGKPILKWIGICQGSFLLAFISSPFFWIWDSWSFAWKIGITGMAGTLLMYGLYKGVKHLVKEAVNNDFIKHGL